MPFGYLQMASIVLLPFINTIDGYIHCICHMPYRHTMQSNTLIIAKCEPAQLTWQRHRHSEHRMVHEELGQEEGCHKQRHTRQNYAKCLHRRFVAAGSMTDDLTGSLECLQMPMVECRESAGQFLRLLFLHWKTKKFEFHWGRYGIITGYFSVFDNYITKSKIVPIY